MSGGFHRPVNKIGNGTTTQNKDLQYSFVLELNKNKLEDYPSLNSWNTYQ